MLLAELAPANMPRKGDIGWDQCRAVLIGLGEAHACQK